MKQESAASILVCKLESQKPVLFDTYETHSNIVFPSMLPRNQFIDNMKYKYT